MIVTMRNFWARFLALSCAAALYGGTLAPVCGAQELAQNAVFTQLTVLLGEVGVSVDAARFPIDSSDSSQEFHLRWTTGDEAPPSPSPLANPSAGELTVVTIRITAGPRASAPLTATGYKSPVRRCRGRRERTPELDHRSRPSYYPC